MDKVYLVQKICDDEYSCRETVYVSASPEGAREYIVKQKDDKEIMGWNGVPCQMYIIEKWEIDP